MRNFGYVVRWCVLAVLAGVATPQVFASSVDPFEVLPEPDAPRTVLPQLDESFTVLERAQLSQATRAFEAGDFARSETLSRSVTESLPDAPEGWHMLGMALANQDKLAPAVVALTRAGDLYEFNAEPHRLAGDMLVSLGQTEAARAAYGAALAKDPENWRAAESLGVLLEQLGDLEAARASYDQALAAAPASQVGPSLRLAVVEIGLGEVEGGIDRLVAVLKDRPDLEDVRTAVVRQLAVLGRIEDAADVLAAAADAAPNDASTVLLAARTELGALRVDAARDRLNAAREVLDDNPETLLAIGTLLGAARDYDGAAEAYSAGLALAPEDVGLLRGLRTAHYRKGDMANARTAAITVTSRADASAEDALWLGFIEEALDAPDAAITAYRAALDRDAANWIAANNLASLLIPSDPAEAVGLAERAVAASDGGTQPRITLGLALRAASRTGDAVAVFSELAQMPDATARTIYRHGQALIENGSTEAGKAEVARALALDPNFEDAEAARDLLRP